MTTTTVSTPGLTRAVQIDAQLRALREEQAEIFGRIVADAEFMDVPIRRIAQLSSLPVSEVTDLGGTWHVLEQYSERSDRRSLFGHPADECPGHWCSEVGVPRRRKFERAGDRWWHTFLGDHVLVGRDDGIAPELIFIPIEVDRPGH
jgi:hypothetical protein